MKRILTSLAVLAAIMTLSSSVLAQQAGPRGQGGQGQRQERPGGQMQRGGEQWQTMMRQAEDRALNKVGINAQQKRQIDDLRKKRDEAQTKFRAEVQKWREKNGGRPGGAGAGQGQPPRGQGGQGAGRGQGQGQGQAGQGAGRGHGQRPGGPEAGGRMGNLPPELQAKGRKIMEDYRGGLEKVLGKQKFTQFEAAMREEMQKMRDQMMQNRGGQPGQGGQRGGRPGGGQRGGGSTASTGA
jgi:hypothetical protein